MFYDYHNTEFQEPPTSKVCIGAMN